MPVRAPALAGVLLASLPVHAAEPFEGRWAEDPAWCPRTDTPLDERPVTITRREIDFYVSACKVVRVRKLGPNRYRLEARCREEGETGPPVRSTFDLTLAEGRLAVASGGGAWTFTRCPERAP